MKKQSPLILFVIPTCPSLNTHCQQWFTHTHFKNWLDKHKRNKNENSPWNDDCMVLRKEKTVEKSKHWNMLLCIVEHTEKLQCCSKTEIILGLRASICHRRMIFQLEHFLLSILKFQLKNLEWNLIFFIGFTLIWIQKLLMRHAWFWRQQEHNEEIINYWIIILKCHLLIHSFQIVLGPIPCSRKQILIELLQTYFHSLNIYLRITIHS